MSAPVDVLALVKAQAAHHLALSRADAFSAQEAPKWMEAALAIGELINADKALDAIDSELPCVPEDMPDPMAYLRRRDEALTRRAVALARVQGHQP